MFGGTVRAVTLVSITFLVAALAACSSDPTPIEPSASPSVSADVPRTFEIPPEALEDTEAGAIAFIEHYLEVFNYAANTGDVEPLRELSHPDCGDCVRYAADFEEHHSSGGIRGFRWSMSGYENHAVPGAYVIELEVDQYEARDADDEEFRPVEGGSYELGFEVVGSGVERKIGTMFLLESE